MSNDFVLVGGMGNSPLGVQHTVWHGTFRLGRRRCLDSSMTVDQKTGKNDDDENEDAEQDPFSGALGRADLLVCEGLHGTLLAAGFFIVQELVSRRMVWHLPLLSPQRYLFQQWSGHLLRCVWVEGKG